jgi:hypothetical protein
MADKRLILIGFIIFIAVALWPSEIIKDIHIGRNLCIDDEQNIYTHYDSYSIIKYSPQGKQLLIIGRRGEGPGDIKRIGWFEINPKDSMLYVTELFNGNRRVSIIGNSISIGMSGNVSLIFNLTNLGMCISRPLRQYGVNISHLKSVLMKGL